MAEEDLILKQFTEARKRLGLQRQQAQQGLEDQLGRQQALTGLQGGAATKVRSKAQKELEQAFTGAESELAGQEAQTKQAESQFQKQFGLQQSQFEEAKNQFAQQIGFQWAEFDENRRTNMINAVTALEKSGLGDPKRLAQMRISLDKIRRTPLRSYR